MEFFGKSPDKKTSGNDWNASMWAFSCEKATDPDKKVLMIATRVEGNVELATAKSLEAFFMENLKKYPSGLPDDLVVFHDWSDIKELDAIKCRMVFKDLLRYVKPVQREIVFNVDLGGKFLGGALIDAVLTSMSIFYKGVINKVSNHGEFKTKVGELERKYGGRRFSLIPPAR